MTWLIGSALGLLGIGGLTAGAAYFLGPMVLLGMGRTAVKAVWGWLCHRSFWQLTTLAACAYIGVQLFELSHARHEAAKWKAQYIHVYTARLADRAAYVKAQAEARALNQAQVATIERKHQEINDERVSDLHARLELIRSELRKATPAPSGAPGSAAAGETVDSPCRASNSAWMCISPEERLHAAENEERHDQLITAVEQQANVDPNKP